MKNLGVLLYSYMAICIDHLLHYVMATLDALAPVPMYRPALQRVRTHVSPGASAIRLRRIF
jgi:hypothetical protein